MKVCGTQGQAQRCGKYCQLLNGTLESKIRTDSNQSQGNVSPGWMSQNLQVLGTPAGHLKPRPSRWNSGRLWIFWFILSPSDHRVTEHRNIWIWWHIQSTWRVPRQLGESVLGCRPDLCLPGADLCTTEWTDGMTFGVGSYYFVIVTYREDFGFY